MPVTFMEKLSEKMISQFRNGTALFIGRSNAHLKAAERLILDGKNPFIWGDILYTPKTFIKTFSDQLMTVAKPAAQKAVIADILSSSTLRYFEHVKYEHSIIAEFYSAINTLRQNLISAARLEKDLAERGSLKEFDLLNTYKKYEERLEKTGVCDEGSLILSAIDRLQNGTAGNLDGIKTIFLDGFEILSPGIAALVNLISKQRPGISTVFIVNKQEDNPVYSRYLKIAGESFRQLESVSNSPLKMEIENNGGGWNLPAKPQIVRCRSNGNQWRFICGKITELIEGGTPPEEIGLVIPRNSENLSGLIETMKTTGLLPEIGARNYEGRLGLLRKIVTSAESIDDIKKSLSEMLAPSLVNSIKSDGHPFQAAKNLTDLQNIFDTIFTLENLTGANLKLETTREIILAEMAGNAGPLIDQGSSPFNWLWWDEAVFPELSSVIIASANQGETPPEAKPSVFFQDASFLPPDSPIYFSLLFPQADLMRSQEAIRFRKYLSTAKENIILSYSQINSQGKETYPTNLASLFDKEEIETGLFPVAFEPDMINIDSIMSRAAHEAETAARPRKNAPSVISNPQIKKKIHDIFLKNIFSASQLERYGRCPYQYFLNKVADLEPLEPRAPEISPKNRGTIIHRIMELFYENETVNIFAFMRGEIDFKGLVEMLDNYTEQAAEENTELLKDIHPALVDNFKKRARTTCVEAVKLEIDLLKEMSYPLYPTYTEKEFGTDGVPPLELKHPSLAEPAFLKGIIDRIDVDEEHNTFSITDYKTGATESVIGKIPKGEHLQLPIYIEASRNIFMKDKNIAGAFLFSLKKMRKMHGIAKKDMKDYYFGTMNRNLFVDDDKWDELMNAALEKASEYINGIRAADFAENTANCNNLCDYKDICRYAKR